MQYQEIFNLLSGSFQPVWSPEKREVKSRIIEVEDFPDCQISKNPYTRAPNDEPRTSTAWDLNMR